VVKNGRYKFTRSNGPTAGPHQVIVSLDTGGKKATMPQAGKRSGAAAEPASPAMASRKRWELQIDVPETGPFEHDISLE
jgi:hypothetical protein